MAESIFSDAGSMPPEARLIEMATAGWVSMVVHAAARFDLADHLADGSKTAEQLAGPTGTHAPSLYRLMRTLASLGILSEDSTGRFALTPMGEALRTGAPGSARATILTFGSDWFRHAMGQFPNSVKTGKSATEIALGKSLFEWLAQQPEAASLFSESMMGFHGREPAAVATAYDFDGVETIVDVGGATGHMLTTILNRYHGPRGVLFDLPHVESDARALIQVRGLADRITIESGSFFDAVPAGGEVYLLSHVIHNWREEQCLEILRNCRDAMNPDGRLLLIEMVLPPGDAPHPGKMLDMIMLMGPGGQERTEEEYRALLKKSGFRLTRVVPTQSAVSVVEAVQA